MMPKRKKQLLEQSDYCKKKRKKVNAVVWESQIHAGINSGHRNMFHQESTVSCNFDKTRQNVGFHMNLEAH